MRRRWMNFEDEEPMFFGDLAVTLDCQITWPNGESQEVIARVPLEVLLTNREHFAEEWLRMLDFAAHSGGILKANQHLTLVTRDETGN